jgi:transposase InsO family protein
MREENYCAKSDSSETTFILNIGSGKQIFAHINLNGKRREALIDTGAGVSVIDKNCVSQEEIFQTRKVCRLVTANGEEIKIYGKAAVQMEIGYLLLSKNVMVVGGLPKDTVILGNDIFSKYGLQLDCSDQTLILHSSGVVNWFYRGQDDKTSEDSQNKVLSVLTAISRDDGCPNEELNHEKETMYTTEGVGVEREKQEEKSHVTGLITQTTGSSRDNDCNMNMNVEKRDVNLKLLLSNDKGQAIATDSLTHARMAPNTHILEEKNHSQTNMNKGRPVTLDGSVCLPPNSSLFVPVLTCFDKDSEDYVFAPCIKTELRYGVLFTPGITNSPSWKVLIMNLTDSIASLKNKMVIGDIHPSRLLPDEQPSTIHINSLNAKPVERGNGMKFDPALFDICPNASEEDKAGLIAILEEFWDVFAVDNKQLGCTDVVQHKIDTGNTPPVRQRLWNRYSREENEIIAEQVKEMLECGVITRGYSPWCSNVVLATDKKTGKIRFCTDYRALNAVTTFQSYNIPRIEDVLDSLAGSTCFHSIDLIRGYWQIKMCEEDGSDLKTAFITRDGTFVYKRMPFGVVNGPHEFQLLMDQVFGDLRGKVAVYMDDLTPHGRTGKEANAHLYETLLRLRKINMKVHVRKCAFLYDNIKLLGFIINNQGVSPDPEKVRAIEHMPIPDSVKKLRSFIGMVNFYRKFVPKLAFHAKPLYDLLKKDEGKKAWTETHTNSFTKIKSCLLSADTLVHYDPSLPVELHTDACDYAVAGVLIHVVSQEHNGKMRRVEKPIQFTSRTLRPSELKWSIPEKECLALMYCLSVFRPFLAMQYFTIRTDAIALTYLKNMRDPQKSRIARWGIKLSEFKCDIVHRPGKKNVVADALSRNPNPFDKPLDPHEAVEVPLFGLRCKVRSMGECEDGLLEEELPPAEHAHMDITHLQLLDDWCKDIYEHIEDHIHFAIIQGMLFRITINKSEKRYRIACPLAIRGYVIESYHSSKFTAHLGRDKTYDKIKSRFYWPNMKGEIIRFIQRCLSCKIHKTRTVKRHGPLQPIDPHKKLTNLQPGDFLSADILGPFPLSVKGNRFIIVVTDLLTRFVVCGALVDSTAFTVAEFLVNQVICVYGAFRFLLTDNGKCFQAKLLREVAKFVGFAQGFTNPYTPECNGTTERFNKTIAEMLSHYIPETPLSEWDKNIPPVVFAYNTSLHKTLQEIPHYLMFSRNPRLPQDTIFSLPSSSLSADSILSRLKIAFEHANQQLLATHESEKRRFNVTVDTSSFRIGDIVMYEIPIRKKGEPDKLQPKRKGPYQIISKLSDQSFIIQAVDRTTQPEKVSARKLFLFYPNTDLLPITGDSGLSQCSTVTEVNTEITLAANSEENPISEPSLPTLPTLPCIVPPRRSARLKSKSQVTYDEDFGCHGNQGDDGLCSSRISLLRVGWCCPECFFG